jgi:hypothetical protein
MQTPTTAELLNAIEVLGKLGERINLHAVRSVRQIPNTYLAGHVAGQIGVNASEQTRRAEAVTEQLKDWRNELLQQQKRHVSQSV